MTVTIVVKEMMDHTYAVGCVEYDVDVYGCDTPEEAIEKTATQLELSAGNEITAHVVSEFNGVTVDDQMIVHTVA